MTFKQAFKKLQKIAGRRYSVLRFEVVSFSSRNEEIRCSAYIDGGDWTMDHPTFEDALLAVEKSLEAEK